MLFGGRRPKLSPQQQAKIRRMVSTGGKTATNAARLFKIHPVTLVARQNIFLHEYRPY
jgi:DNA invertase Pin-like site-specific DNA recombinase